MPTKYSFHDKRVTLQLARLSTVADQSPDLAAALTVLPGLGFDVYKLSQEHQEALFAELDEELEQRIKEQFVADPTYLLDLGPAMGTCPLCGHVGCRYIFRITNTLNGKSIECGSECIVTHGLCVKGAETAEHARKALETTIRRHIRKLKIEAWHKETGFDRVLFQKLEEGLVGIFGNRSLPWKVRNSARYKFRYDLPKLVKFYDRNGWLNTGKRWAEWTRLVVFARKHDFVTREAMSHPLPREPEEVWKIDIPEIDTAAADLEQQASDEAAFLAEQEAAKVDAAAPMSNPAIPQPAGEDLPLSDLVDDLVFG